MLINMLLPLNVTGQSAEGGAVAPQGAGTSGFGALFAMLQGMTQDGQQQAVQQIMQGQQDWITPRLLQQTPMGMQEGVYQAGKLDLTGIIDSGQTQGALITVRQEFLVSGLQEGLFVQQYVVRETKIALPDFDFSSQANFDNLMNWIDEQLALDPAGFDSAMVLANMTSFGNQDVVEGFRDIDVSFGFFVKTADSVDIGNASMDAAEDLGSGWAFVPAALLEDQAVFAGVDGGSRDLFSSIADRLRELSNLYRERLTGQNAGADAAKVQDIDELPVVFTQKDTAYRSTFFELASLARLARQSERVTGMEGQEILPPLAQGQAAVQQVGVVQSVTVTTMQGVAARAGAMFGQQGQVPGTMAQATGATAQAAKAETQIAMTKTVDTSFQQELEDGWNLWPSAMQRMMHQINSPQQVQQQMMQAPVADQIAVRIQQAVQGGHDKLSIKLFPPELGRIEVKIEYDRLTGRAMVDIMATSQDTLDLLQRDARLLERALQDAGLDAEGGMSFSLGGGDSQQNATRQQKAVPGYQPDYAGAEEDIDDWMMDDGGEDLMVTRYGVNIRV